LALSIDNSLRERSEEPFNLLTFGSNECRGMNRDNANPVPTGNPSTAVAHANIALAKYWGKFDRTENLPAVSSISLTLKALQTRTRVRFSADLTVDRLLLNGREAERVETNRVCRFLDRVRDLASIADRAQVDSDNNFPTAAGLASSASGFAALALAASQAAGLTLTPSQWSALARYGSASAARSIFGGFVEFTSSINAQAAAKQLVPCEHWPLTVLVAVTSTVRKEHSSTQAMNISAETSPYYRGWVESSEADVADMRSAIVNRDFAKLGAVAERSCLKLHGLIMSGDPPILYWNPVTLALINAIRDLQKSAVAVFFSIDAGPQLKAICEPAHSETVRAALLSTPGVAQVLQSDLGPGAHFAEDIP
jgi:diphosphomevalonate decarboxylase